MYTDRHEFYQNLEQSRNSKILLYITGDREGLETQIGKDVFDYFVFHLDRLWTTHDSSQPKRISLYLYTRGGDTLASWGLSNLLRQFCDYLEIIVPSKSYSGGTLIALAADSIIMTKQATLGPIDPSVHTPLNPQIPGGAPTAKAPVSVEEISGYIDFVRDTIGTPRAEDLKDVVINLTQHIHPLVLGKSFRTRSQIRMLGEKLLAYHISDIEKTKTILSFLCGESGSHDYPINRKEARDHIGLPIERPDDELYRLIKAVYDDFSIELELTNPYNPNVILGAAQETPYIFRRALIESLNGGSHVFLSEGILEKQRIQVQPGLIQEAIRDSRQKEGWQHEHNPY